MTKKFLELRNVTKQYGNKIVLNGINLDIYQGEIISLLGVNGAGKTTLSSIVASIHPLTSGEIIFEDKSIYKNIIEYRRHVGYCPQKPNFASQLTVEEHLKLAGKYFLMPKYDIEKRAEYLMAKFNLNEYAKKFCSILSGGYKQRLLLARSLMHNPSLIILDEPTVALDPHIRHQLWDFIKTLKNDNITVLLTTHYLDEAEILSDRICLLDKGIIKLVDTPKNLISTYNQAKLEDVFIKLMNEES